MAKAKSIIVASEVAKNGMKIDAVVTRVRREGTKNCWRGEAKVDGTGMAFGHKNTRAEAEEWAIGMQGAYLETHSK